MTRGLRNITAREIVSALKKDGFHMSRQKGSHQYYRKGNYVVVVSYHHPGKTIPIGTLHEIIKDAGWTEDDLKRLKLIK